LGLPAKVSNSRFSSRNLIIKLFTMTQSEITTILSQRNVATTIDRLASLAVSKGLMIFARIDHGKGAADAGMPLRPTQLLTFGNPKGGTPLMQDRQIAGLDLPLHALAWQDKSERVWLSYSSGSVIAARHSLTAASHTAVEAIDKGMAMLCALAAGEDAFPDSR
jgi:uncharacterized protein (DUF302 family)